MRTPTPTNDTIRWIVPTLDRSIMKSLTTTTAIKTAPAIQAARRRQLDSERLRPAGEGGLPMTRHGPRDPRTAERERGEERAGGESPGDDRPDGGAGDERVDPPADLPAPERGEKPYPHRVGA